MHRVFALVAVVVLLVAAVEARADGPSKAKPTLDAKTLCPPNVGRTKSMTGQLNRGLSGLGTKKLQAALRRSAVGWRRQKVQAHPAGRAGAWADTVWSRYKKGRHQIGVSITDMIRVCTCVAGSGRTLTRSGYGVTKGVSSRVIKVGRLEARLSRLKKARTLALWVGDRCLISVDNVSALSAKQLVAALGIVDLKALRKTCKQRKKRGLF